MSLRASMFRSYKEGLLTPEQYSKKEESKKRARQKKEIVSKKLKIARIKKDIEAQKTRRAEIKLFSMGRKK